MNKIIQAFLLFSVFLFALSGCSKDEEVKEGCINMKLEEMGMIPYTGQQLDCSFFLELYVFKKKEYFILGNHCIDMHVFPMDCEGTSLCESVLTSGCVRFYDDAVFIGIVGIEVP